MKKVFFALSIVLFCAAVLLVVTDGTIAGTQRWIKIGNLWDKVVDSTDEGYGPGAYSFGKYYYDGFGPEWMVWDYRRLAIMCTDWTDESGSTHAYKMTGFAAWSDEQTELMPVPDASGITLKRYFRDTPPTIMVDGNNIEEPFPRQGDEVAPEKIPGTADMMIESHVRTSMGVDIHQKVLAWSQKNHDDYLIYDFTFTNTGNIDLDDEIELPNQTINGFYLNRSAAWGWKGHMNGYYGSRTDDSLRVLFSYPDWNGDPDSDGFGDADKAAGFLNSPWFQGWAILHADVSGSDHTDDPEQPRMTGFYDSEAQFMRKPAYELSPEQQIQMYTMASQGLAQTPGIVGEHPLQEGGDFIANVIHEVPMDEQAAMFGNPWVYSWTGGPSWITYIPIGIFSVGPYNLAPGQSVRVVWAHCMGSVSPQKAWEIGTRWKNDELTLADAPDTEPLPHAEIVYGLMSYDDNDKAKDLWVTTGRDSMLAAANAAQWAVRNNYQVPIPPPAPSVIISSGSEDISVEWGAEAEGTPDLAGYRIYRAMGSAYYSEENNQIVGSWQLIHEAEAGTFIFKDNTAIRGFHYFYHVAAYDDGTHPEAAIAGGVNGKTEPLESGRWLNYTRTSLGAARLLSAPGKNFDDVRVVPNPYNARSHREGMHWPKKRQIGFFNLPAVCTIKIYTESGDLIRTIEHINTAGDEEWVDPTGFNSMDTRSDQIPASGIYIAYIEVSEDIVDSDTGAVVYKKGESCFKHFVIIH
ncbi:hypothetical protein KAR48_11155 [bacterium]|nr:hypothetical protein [bacterium]